MRIENVKRFYHGSYTVVEKPDLAKCGKGKDFGQGFYLTTDIEQARRFVRSSIGKAVKNGDCEKNHKIGYVSVYEFTDADGIETYEFESADREWLHCVAMHRRDGLFRDDINRWKKYDMISGKIANDNTNQVITAYINGLYGVVGSEIADRTAIGLLMPEKLTDQICLRTENALKKLKYMSCEEVIVKERR
ncbi:MAG: DUF3990 domain-containing protein [Butyrivibrio sp.]|nr:DUF3990 domain-containing protein [Butyrivibrio sp.]